jgi:hypothetical protein
MDSSTDRVPLEFLLSLRFPLATFVFAPLLALPLYAQGPPAQAAGSSPAQARAQANVALGDSLQQMNVTTDRLHRALASINVAKWKAPGDVRETTQSDVDSMQRDLAGTLPSLISNALANPGKVSPVFSVYRNVDALYDVLLRVSETAQLAGTNDARVLEDQRGELESSRTQLGTALLQSAQAQDAELVQLHTAAAVPPPAPPTKTVIDDGPPAKTKSTKTRTRKPAPAPPPQ